ncbi:MAG: hypothetical protein KJO69_06485, partial [Gammaproteobacteria bacterium]|nr:hypothetical protein [Gammaproteobacteria bacterium]
MKKLITLLVLAFVSQTLMAQNVDYGVRYDASSCKYEAYAVASGAFTPAFAGSSLFTVAVPSGVSNSAVSGITSVNGGTWAKVSEAYTSSTDFYAFALSASGAYGSGIGSIASGDTVVLFRFDLDNDDCASGVRPWLSSDGADPASQGYSYTNSFNINGSDKYNANATSTVPLTDPAINSMVPNCVATVHGINVSASAQGPAACGSSSLSYSWTGPNSFSATTANITVPDNVASIGS